MSPSPAVPTANLAPSGGTLKELVVFMLLMCVLGQNMAFSAVEEIHYSLPEVPIAWGGGFQVGVIPLYPLFSIPLSTHNPSTKLGLMLLHAKLPFHDGCFSLPSFAGFSAPAQSKFSSNSRIDPCEQGEEQGGWWEPGSVWVRRRGGMDGNAARFLGLRHPPNATVQTSQTPKQCCSRHRMGWE